MIPRTLLLTVIVACLFMVLVITVRAHQAPTGWDYPWECCHDRDCSQIDSSRVKEQGAGYLIDGSIYVAPKDVRVSPDGAFHACFPFNKLRCFFAPPRGV